MKSIECRSSPESIQKFVVPEDIFDAVVNPEFWLDKLDNLSL